MPTTVRSETAFLGDRPGVQSRIYIYIYMYNYIYIYQIERKPTDGDRMMLEFCHELSKS